MLSSSRAAVVVLSLTVAVGAAQSPSTPETAVDKIFEAYSKPGAPGCAVGVIRDSKLVFARGYGLANIEHEIALTPKSVFDIGSTSKQFTAAAILLLEQQGKLSLDDEVRTLIPELPDYGRSVTIRHLLHHTSGIRDYLTLMSVIGVNFDGVTTDEDALKIIVRQKALNFTPGTEHLYSNSGYFLLAVLAKRASGKSLRDFAQEQIFSPLGMTDTHFHDDHTMPVMRRASGYSPGPRGYRIDMSGFEQTGDGAVYTTIEDLAKWDLNFYEPKVGGQRLIDGLLHKGVLNDGTALDYAAGLLNAKYKGLTAVSHGGSWAGYRAELIRFPAQQFSVICLCNRADGNPSAKAREVADVYLAPELSTAPAGTAGRTKAAPPTPVDVPREQLERRAGAYRNVVTGAIRRIELANGRLRIGQQSLIPLASDRFFVENAPVETILVFARTETGQQASLTRAGGAVETWEQLHAPALTPQALARMAGTYYSDELDTIATLKVENDRLLYSGPAVSPRPLEPLARDTFINGTWQFEISRDASGNVDGFLLHAGRIRGLRFTKK